MRKVVVALAIASAVISSAVQAKKERVTWQVMRASDPITKASTCAVVASDFVGKTRFTQTGGLYPVVEMNSTYGLLVGVSSGGRFRLPTGDILWVVDDHPYRIIKAAENPGTPSAPGPAGDAARAVESVTAYAMQLARGATATSTMASGAKAGEMLEEMLRGRSLLFRAAGSGPQTGLPDYSAMMAGQVSEKGQVHPVPLETSFRAALLECGIIG